MADGAIGYGAEFEVRDGTQTDSDFVSIGLITSITPPSDTVDQIEITHMQSPNRQKQFVAGLSDPGEMSLELNYMPGSPTDEFILAWRASGETRECRISYPTTASLVDTFPAFVSSYVPNIPANDRMSATLGLKVAGAPVRSGSVTTP